MTEYGPSAELLEKYEKLLDYLKSLESVAVAFSSGVDSTFLLYAAKEALGENMLAVTASSGSFPQREFAEAKEYCGKLGVKHLISVMDELEIEGFAQNPPNRCYICKLAIFKKIQQLAKEHNMAEVAEGSNLDDVGDYRPGMAAIAELGIKSPLRHCNLSKEEIRILSRHLNLPTWNKPSYACLASRIPYGEEITKEKLEMVDRAEQFLIDLGFEQMRVRVHGQVARIELLPDDFDRFLVHEMRDKVYAELKAIGFDYVSLDLKGYRTGSLNETLKR